MNRIYIVFVLFMRDAVSMPGKERAIPKDTSMTSVRDRLTKIETRLEHMPTKAEFHKEISDQTWKLITWVTGIATLLVAATFFIAKQVA